MLRKKEKPRTTPPICSKPLRLLLHKIVCARSASLKPAVRSPSSASNFFEMLGVHIEIRIYGLGIVVIFQRLQQPDHLRRRRAFQLGVA